VRDVKVEGVRTFLRLDLNVPIKDGVILDDTRIRAAIPTLKHLLDRGAIVIACSHLGRPKGRIVPDLSLSPVADRLRDFMPGRRVFFAQDVLGSDAVSQAGALKSGECLLLENIRFEPGETKGSEEVAKRIRNLADLYVSDAFGAVHRAHASVYAAAKLFPVVAAGFLLERELDYLETRLDKPEKPYSAFLGGAKVSDKIPVIRRLLDKVDRLCIGGAMAYTFLAAQGFRTGKSLLEKDLIQACRDILAAAQDRGVTLLLPQDHLAARSLDPGEPVRVVGNMDFPEELAGFDIGPTTLAAFSSAALDSRTVFWNGPMGVFERPAFAEGTVALARALASSDALTIIGGGDSVSAVHLAGVADKISHISTGGGASLELLAGQELPGLQVLTRTSTSAI
jgi:phosphoglycerate kinase